MSNKADLIDSIKAATDKANLEAIAEIIGYKLHGNKGLERTQSDMIEIVNGASDNSGSDAGTDKPEDTVTEELPEENTAEKLPDNTTRTIRNTKTGVLFTWTETLAKMPEMRED